MPQDNGSASNVQQGSSTNNALPNSGGASDGQQAAAVADKPLSAADILKRAGAPANPVADQSQNQNPDDIVYNSSDIEKIADPMAKKIVQDLYKQIQKGAQDKFKQAAELKKTYESKLSEMSTWSPQRLQQELNRPDFVQAMQALQQQAPPNNWQGSPDEWSALSPQEQQQFQGLQQAVVSQQQQLTKMLQDQEDAKLKSAYPDYNPDLVNKFTDDLLHGRYQATREDIWKVYNHDQNVARAYELGRQDALTKLKDKNDGASLPGSGSYNVSNGNDLPPEVNRKSFVEIARFRLEQAKKNNKR